VRIHRGADPTDLLVADVKSPATVFRRLCFFRWPTAALAFLFISIFLLPTTASAQGHSRMVISESNSSPLTFVSTSPVLTFETSKLASVTVAVQNITAFCREAHFALVILPGKARIAPDSGVPKCFMSGVSVATLTFRRSFNTSMTGAVLSLTPAGPGISQASEGAATQTIVVTLRRSTDYWVNGLLPLILGLGWALLTLAITRLSLGNKYRTCIKASSSWTFKDSWATNITAVGAVLGTVLAATGSASTLLPGVQTDRFAVLSAAWGGLVVLAPLLIALHGRHPADSARSASESAGGASASDAKGVTSQPDATSSAVQALTIMVFIAAFMTLTAAGGELATVGVLTHLSTAPSGLRWPIYICLGAAAALTGLYAGVTTKALVISQDQERPRSALSRFEDTSLTL
jgi:hypothetical protein